MRCGARFVCKLCAFRLTITLCVYDCVCECDCICMHVCVLYILLGINLLIVEIAHNTVR